VNGLATIVLPQYKSSLLNLTVYDEVGRIVDVPHTSTVGDSQNGYRLDTSHLLPGCYNCIIIQGSVMQHVKLIVAR
jgi:hypothetical protein